MAAEIGARLGRANRSKAWLHRQAGISASAWRHYFTAFDRDLPMGVIRQIADVPEMQTTVGELVTLAENDAPNHVAEIRLRSQLSASEEAALDEAIRRTSTDDPTPEEGEGQGRVTGS